MEKEEIIFIFTQQKACDICKENLEEYDGLTPDCGNCSEKEFLRMTRQEAIERMAKAICKRMMNVNCTECNYCQLFLNFTSYAEAALNALLSKEK